MNMNRLPFGVVTVGTSADRVIPVPENGCIAQDACTRAIPGATCISTTASSEVELSIEETKVVDDGEMMHGLVIPEGGNPIISTPLIPSIVNVSTPNERVVMVDFADGTREKAVLSENDTYSVEVGISICITKKLLGGNTPFGSSFYNKVVKNAMKKIDYVKKCQEAEAAAIKAEEEKKRKKAEKSRERRLAAKRAYDVSVHTEAYKNALSQVYAERNAAIDEGMAELQKILEAACVGCEENGQCECDAVEPDKE